MRKLTTTLVAGAAMAISGAAMAQEEGEAPNPTYIINGTMSDTNLVGGVGDDGSGFLSASWSESLTITTVSGETLVELTSQCVGMTQDSGSLFDRHVACTHSNQSGDSTGGVIMGCNREEGGGKMSCMGYFQGKTGAVEGEVAMMVMVYDFEQDGTGTVGGSGYWMGAGDDDEGGDSE